MPRTRPTCGASRRRFAWHGDGGCRVSSSGAEVVELAEALAPESSAPAKRAMRKARARAIVPRLAFRVGEPRRRSACRLTLSPGTSRRSCGGCSEGRLRLWLAPSWNAGSSVRRRERSTTAWRRERLSPTNRGGVVSSLKIFSSSRSLPSCAMSTSSPRSSIVYGRRGIESVDRLVRISLDRGQRGDHRRAEASSVSLLAARKSGSQLPRCSRRGSVASRSPCELACSRQCHNSEDPGGQFRESFEGWAEPFEVEGVERG
jgi:hypothetical protein